MSSTPVLRGRPKSEEKKRAILHAAISLFMRNGFDGTSMDEIALQAGVSKQTVYSHFRSKDDLFRYCVVEKCAEHELSFESFDETLPVETVLMEIANNFNQLLMSDDAVQVKRMIMAEQSAHLAELFYEAGPRRMVGMLSQYLKRQTERGELQVDEPALAASQFLHMLQGERYQGTLMCLQKVPSEEHNQHYLESCVKLFLRACAP